jgi:hypothetical protein
LMAFIENFEFLHHLLDIVCHALSLAQIVRDLCVSVSISCMAPRGRGPQLIFILTLVNDSCIFCPSSTISLTAVAKVTTARVTDNGSMIRAKKSLRLYSASSK